MGRATYQMPDDFLSALSKLEARTDEIVPKVLQAGGEVVLESVRGHLQAVVGVGTKYPSRTTGELINALGVSGARLDRRGNMTVKVGFREPRRDGNSNAQLGNILEHGKSGQPPKPFLKPARIASHAACIERMRQVFEQEVERL